MKIEDIVTEDFGQARAYVSGNQIDPELVALKKRAKQKEKGMDPYHAELVQDFPV